MTDNLDDKEKFLAGLRKDNVPREVYDWAVQMLSAQPTFTGTLPDPKLVPGTIKDQVKDKKMPIRPETPILREEPLARLCAENILFSLGIYHPMVPSSDPETANSMVRQYEHYLGRDTLTRLFYLENPIFIREPSVGWIGDTRWATWPLLIYSMPKAYFDGFGTWLQSQKLYLKDRRILWETRWVTGEYRDPAGFGAAKISVWFALPFCHKGFTRLVFDEKVQLPSADWVPFHDPYLEKFMNKVFNLEET